MPVPRPSSSEISFNLATGATSTPRAKMDSPKEKPKNLIAANFFADNSKSTIGFAPKFEQEKSPALNIPPPATNLIPVNLPPVNLPTSVNLPPAPLAKLETKMNTFIQPPEPKPIDFAPAVDLNIPKPRIEKIVEKQTRPEIKIQKEIPSKDSIQEKSNIDENLCLRAYREEQVNFEKELKAKLEPLIWEVGTKSEKEQIIEKTALIDEFLRDLQETTTSLASDITYLRGFLIQSFAWLEETNSKNSDNVKLSSRNRRENSKLNELQELFYYTQSQLVQASKVLDLQWSEQQSREQKKMKIPNMECIYQSLMRHGQILAKEKSNIDSLIKKWKSIARGNNTVSDLNRSISNLHITSNTSNYSHDSTIDLRCKTIIQMNQNFSREKQMKLRDFLSESAPRIIKPAKPTLIQDRLESTLSSLASMSPPKTISKPKIEQKLNQKPKVQSSPLASLNNIVSKIVEKQESDTKLSISPVKTLPALVPALASQKPKQTINISFAQSPQNLAKPFPKVEAISFGQKSEIDKVTKDIKSGIEKEVVKNLEISPTPAINFTASNPGNILLTPQIQSTFNLQSTAPPPPPSSSSSTVAQNFSFASKPPTNSPAFSFASKPEEKANLDLGGLNLSQSGLTITPISETKITNQSTPAMSSINFGKAGNIFGASGTNFPASPSTNFGTSAPPTTPTANNFGTSNVFGTTSSTTSVTTATTVANTFGSPSIFGTSGANAFGTTNTFATSPFGKSGSIFGGSNSSVSTPPALSSISITSSSSPATPLNNSVTSTNSTPVISSISAVNLTSSPNSSSASGVSSVIVSKPVSVSSPILASSLTSSSNSVAISTPPPNYTSPNVSSTMATSGMDMLSLSLNSSKPTTSISFQTPPTTSIFSTPTFGGAAPASSVASTLNFGTASAITSSNIIAPAFGKEQNSSIFGGSTTTTSQSGSVFGGKSSNTPNANPFGGGNTLAQSPSVFGNANSSGNSIFGGASTTATAFGMKSTPTSTASVFGMSTQPSVFGSGTSDNSTSLFGGASAPKAQETNFSMFGGSSSPAVAAGGGGAGSSVFGQAPAFGAKPAFGASPDFGQAKSVFGSGFGAAPSFGGSPASTGNFQKYIF